jgi:hypothetical protein
MSALEMMALPVALAVAGGAGFAFWSYRRAMREAEAAWRELASRSRPPADLFEPGMVAGLPEIARRYFSRAIAPGTPLRTTGYQTYRMTARQLLAPPFEFVWIPQMQSGLMRVSGSDGLVAGSPWTRFWLMGLLPVANERASRDLLRSAVFRSAMEGIWVPASLLPRNGVLWEQVAADKARITL